MYQLITLIRAFNYMETIYSYTVVEYWSYGFGYAKKPKKSYISKFLENLNTTKCLKELHIKYSSRFSIRFEDHDEYPAVPIHERTKY